MKHPSEATLALYAGQDLGLLARWRTQRHLARCARCRDEAAEFAEIRQDAAADLNELPGISWSRLAAEMKANIRVGLAAGECVRDTRVPLRPLFAGGRAAVACASVAVVLLAALWLERPVPIMPPAPIAQAGISLSATDGGVEVREGNQRFVLKNASTENPTYSAGAQGSIGVRFVDPKSGYLTINTVYVQ